MTLPHPPRANYKQPSHYAPPPPPPGQHSLANYGPIPAAPPPPALRSPIFTPYVAVWSLLGVVALGYIGLVTFAPGVVSNPNPIGGFSDHDGQRFASRITSEITSIKDTIDKLQLDVAKVKTEVEGQAAGDKILAAQLTSLERRMGTPAGNVEASSEPSGAPDDKAAVTPLPLDIEAEAAKPAGSPVQPRVVNAEKPSAGEPALETGSLSAAAAAGAKAVKAGAKPAAAAKPAQPAATAAAIDLGAAVVKPASKPVGVQISSGASVDSLRLSWSLLADRHADTLKNLEARYVARGDEAAPTYDLIAGPVKSKSEAQRVCKALAAKNVPCKVGDFLGEAL